MFSFFPSGWDINLRFHALTYGMPIVMANRVVNLVYGHAEDGATLAPGLEDEVARVCAMAAEEYARIIQSKGKEAVQTNR